VIGPNSDKNWGFFWENLFWMPTLADVSEEFTIISNELSSPNSLCYTGFSERIFGLQRDSAFVCGLRPDYCHFVGCPILSFRQFHMVIRLQFFAIPKPLHFWLWLNALRQLGLHDQSLVLFNEDVLKGAIRI
jgi:hypothetical protein